MVADGRIPISTNTWHYKAVQSTLAKKEGMPRDLCSYVWNLLLKVPVFYALFAVVVVFVYALEFIVTGCEKLWEAGKWLGFIRPIPAPKIWQSAMTVIKSWPLTYQVMAGFAPFIAVLGLATLLYPTALPVSIALLLLWLCIPFMVPTIKWLDKWQSRRNRVEQQAPQKVRRLSLFSLLFTAIKSFKERHCHLVEYKDEDEK